MAQNSALSTLKDLAEKEVDDAALQLGAMRRGCQQAEEQLKMLIDYQHEYRTNLNTDMTQGIGSQRWINYQQFIQTLEKAIEQHRQLLASDDRIGSKGVVLISGDQAILHSPGHRVSTPGILRYVGEGHLFVALRRTGAAVEQHYGLGPGQGSVGRKGVGVGTVEDTKSIELPDLLIAPVLR